ncbi:zinc finger HIT domain-containing protein 1-like [Watersipora subatra]|uniref:zinc finger HIT domain-containing protein 1-like n=1 Tax=Watersipora subatra TaxID=2589382 RepID=UPI00355B4D11
MGDKRDRESGRQKEMAGRRVLDNASRQRRLRKAIEALEQDNYQDDPHADLKMNKKAPKFDESMDFSAAKKKRKSRSESFRYRLKKNFAALVEEEQISKKDGPNFLNALVPSPTYPARHFCAVCGYFSNYTCVACGTRYCSVRCLGTHQDTRCLKWTA